MDSLHAKGVAIINSAVFNAGFLTGGEFFNYVKLDPSNPADQEKFNWREKFFALCEQHGQGRPKSAFSSASRIPASWRSR